MAQARAGDGNVPITIDGTEYVLVPSLEAGISLSNSDGGIGTAIAAVSSLNIPAIARVIRAGVGPKVAPKIKDLERKVFDSGLTDSGGITKPCLDFLTNLARGGRPPPKAEDEDGEGDTPKDPPQGG